MRTINANHQPDTRRSFGRRFRDLEAKTTFVFAGQVYVKFGDDCGVYRESGKLRPKRFHGAEKIEFPRNYAYYAVATGDSEAMRVATEAVQSFLARREVGQNYYYCLDWLEGGESKRIRRLGTSAELWTDFEAVKTAADVGENGRPQILDFWHIDV